MTEFTRRATLAAAGVALTAGCLSGAGDPADASTTTDGTPGSESTPGKTARLTETTTGDWIDHASNSPDPDHAITVDNDADEAKTLRVWVERDATGETVFDRTKTVEPGHEFTAYNLEDANPDGVEAFTVCGELVASDSTAGTLTTTPTERTTADAERRDCATVETSECYGRVHVTVQADGTPQIIYAIC